MTSIAAPQEPEGPDRPGRPGRPGPEEPGPSGTPGTQAPAGWCGQYPTAGLGKALAGNLTFLNPRFLDDADCVAALESLALLKAWTDAQTARTIYHRLTTHTHTLKTATTRPLTSEDAPGAATIAPTKNGVATSNGSATPRSAAASQPPADLRTTAQLRADIFSDLLTHWCAHNTTTAAITTTSRTDSTVNTDSTGAGARAGASTDAGTLPGKDTRAEILITVSAAALTGATNDPAELEGYGPIPIETAHHAAAEAPTWGRLLTDPVTGTALALDRTRYTPTKAIRTWLRARDKTCTFPGCQRAAGACDIDHTIPFSRGGPTDHTNLATICPKHHMLKTEGIIHATQPTPGTINWTSPTGKTYQTRPEPPPF